jgi:hypothetical protein
VQALDKIPLIRAIINLIVDFIRDKVAQWIIDRGGWVRTRNYIRLLFCGKVTACHDSYVQWCIARLRKLAIK